MATKIDQPIDADDIEELRNIIEDQETEIADLKTRLATYDDMAMEYERGGYEPIIDGLKQRISTLRRQVERESQAKVAALRASERHRKRAFALGANANVILDGGPR